MRKGEYDASAEARVNMMDFRINDETRSWFEDAFPLVKRFVAEGGYRLYPASVTAPATARKGAKVTVTTDWRNMGWGYCPTNIPQWNQKYKVGIALLDASGRAVKIITEKKSDLSKWLRESPASYDTSVSLGGLPCGTYTWGIALIDTTRGNTPALEMAVDTSLLTPEGWLKAGQITID